MNNHDEINEGRKFLLRNYTINDIKILKNELIKISYEKTVHLSIEAVKSFILINGGAAVAMLAFCGNHIEMINFCSILAIVIFAAGTAIGGVALMIGHDAQGCYTFDQRELGHTKKHKYLIFFWCSMVCFGIGVIFSICTLIC